MTALRAVLLARCRRLEGDPDALAPYVAGDDARRIDWAASARCGELLARQRDSSADLRLAAIVDESGVLHVGRRRLLIEAAFEMRSAWFQAGSSNRVSVAFPTNKAPTLQSALRAALAHHSHVSALLLICGAFARPEKAPLRRAASRCDCTVMIARDPWEGDLPVYGFARVRDAAGEGARPLFFSPRSRGQFAQAVAHNQRAVIAQYRSCGWRVGVFGEANPVAALHATFGVRCT